MVLLHLNPSSLEGDLFIPPSKSHTLRSILFAALAKGTSQIDHFLISPDTTAMIEAVRQLGATVQISENRLCIRGVGGRLQVADDVIGCGNSGQVLRFIGAIASLIPHYTLLTGDVSIRHYRPIAPLLGALTQLGAFAQSARGDGFAPIMVKGPILYDKAYLDGADSQPVSGLLMALSFAPHPVELYVDHPGETPWIDVTLDWLNRFHIQYEMSDYRYYRLKGRSAIDSFSYEVSGDFSTAAFSIVAALITQSEVRLHNLDFNSVQGDKSVIGLLEQMGASFDYDDEEKVLHVKRSQQLCGMKIDVNPFIDALPILAVVGCFAKGKTELFNGAIARKKESNRISLIALELRKMGALIEEKEDGLIIEESRLKGAHLQSHNDHRLALSLFVASLGAQGSTTLDGVECMNKTYPNCVRDFERIRR